MKCPKCNMDMTSMAYQGVMVDRCGSCHGILVEKGELEVVLDKKLATAFDVGSVKEDTSDANSKPAHCYRCDAAMMTIEGAAKVQFDWCDACGAMFFDKGELKIIDAFRED